MTEVYPVFVLGALNPEAVNKYSSNQIVLTTTICDKSRMGSTTAVPRRNPNVD